MARTLDQIIAEIGSPYQSQINTLQERAASLPEQIKAEEAGLAAKQNEAFGNILSGARQRGLGFSGIPLGEQARYTATEYLPSLARLRQSGREQAMSLQDAIANVQIQRNQYAQTLRQAELDREQQQAQFERELAARRAAQAAQTADLSKYFAQQNMAAQPSYTANNGSFAFFGADRTPITAAQYASQTGQELGDILYQMGQAGDRTAAQVYNQLKQVSFDPQLYQRSLAMYQKTLPHLLGGV